MKSSVRFSIWFSLVLVSAFAVGFFAWVKSTYDWPYDNTFYPYPENSKKVSPSTSLGTPGDYAGWKTYRNEEYGFEFKYPSNWKFYSRNGGLEPDWNLWYSVINDETSRPEIGVNILPLGGRLDYYVLPLIEPQLRDGMLDGEPAKIAEWKIDDGGKFIFYQLVEDKENWTKCYMDIINCNHIEIKLERQDEKLINQILSTFKFIE